MKTVGKPKLDCRDLDPDEYFSESRMSFGDHIEELRLHLWRAIVGFLLAVIICFLPWIGKPILNFISAPVEAQLKEYHAREFERKKKELLASEEGKKLIEPQKVDIIIARADGPKLKLDLKEDLVLSVKIRQDNVEKTLEAGAKLYRHDGLSFLKVEEAFMVYVKVCLVAGFVLASPWVFFQIWSFVAAGLYPHEKRLVNYYLPFSIFLFPFGVVFCEWIVIPRAVEALLWFGEWLNFRPDLRLSEWLGFAIILPVVFGLTFQTPLVMLFVYKIGVVDIEGFGKVRKYAYFGLAIAAAVLTPTGDPQTMLLMWAPMCLFYEFGILLCKMVPGGRLLEFDAEDSDEVIEV